MREVHQLAGGASFRANPNAGPPVINTMIPLERSTYLPLMSWRMLVSQPAAPTLASSRFFRPNRLIIPIIPPSPPLFLTTTTPELVLSTIAKVIAIPLTSVIGRIGNGNELIPPFPFPLCP